MHVIAGLGIGGAERMLCKLVAASTQRTHIVVSLSSVGELGQVLRVQGISVYSLGMTSPLSVFRAGLRLLYLVRRERPDVLQTWMYHADFLGGLIGKLSGIRVVWGVRTTELPRSGSRMTRWLRAWCARLSETLPDRIVYAADASRRLHERLGYSSLKSVVIPNGFQVERLRYGWTKREVMRQSFHLNDGDVVIGYVGRFHDDKDPKNFLSAAAKLMQQRRNVRLVMIGRDLVTENVELGRWIQGLKLEGRVLLLGERSDIPECLSAMDLFCLSSRTEGFPNVLGEAMGVGVPCVATDVGDVKLVLGDCGRVVPRESAALLADGMNEVLSWTASERELRIYAGRQRIAEHYSIEATCSMFELLFDGSISERG